MVVAADDLTEDEVVASIEETLSEELDVHPSDIEVSYDPATGVVTYTITSDDAESLADVIDTMQEEGFEGLIEGTEGLAVEFYEAPSDVTATVDVIVDAPNADVVDATIDAITQALQEQDPDANIVGEGINLFH